MNRTRIRFHQTKGADDLPLRSVGGNLDQKPGVGDVFEFLIEETSHVEAELGLIELTQIGMAHSPDEAVGLALSKDVKTLVVGAIGIDAHVNRSLKWPGAVPHLFPPTLPVDRPVTT